MGQPTRLLGRLNIHPHMPQGQQPGSSKDEPPLCHWPSQADTVGPLRATARPEAAPSSRVEGRDQHWGLLAGVAHLSRPHVLCSPCPAPATGRELRVPTGQPAEALQAHGPATTRGRAPSPGGGSFRTGQDGAQRLPAAARPRPSTAAGHQAAGRAALALTEWEVARAPSGPRWP